MNSLTLLLAADRIAQLHAEGDSERRAAVARRREPSPIGWLRRTRLALSAALAGTPNGATPTSAATPPAPAGSVGAAEMTRKGIAPLPAAGHRG